MHGSWGTCNSIRTCTEAKGREGGDEEVGLEEALAPRFLVYQ